MAIFRYPDPTPTLPFLHGFSVKKKAKTASSDFQVVSGQETRVLTQAFPIWEFELTYEGLPTETQNIDADKYLQYKGLQNYEGILAVFLACKGQYGRFFFSDPSDCSRASQFIGSGNGSRTAFRLIRTISSGNLAFTEPVGGIDLSVAPVVYLNGGVLTDDWFIGDDLQTLLFDAAPVGQITMDYYYFYYCKFTDDMQDFEEFMRNLHTVQSFKFESTKDCDTNSPNPWYYGYW